MQDYLTLRLFINFAAKPVTIFLKKKLKIRSIFFLIILTKKKAKIPKKNPDKYQT